MEQQSVVECREEIRSLLLSRIGQFNRERRIARKRLLRKAAWRGFVRGFFSLGDGFCMLIDSLHGKSDTKDRLKAETAADTRAAMNVYKNEWEQAYAQFWQEQYKLEEAIVAKYGFSDRADFYSQLTSRG